MTHRSHAGGGSWSYRPCTASFEPGQSAITLYLDIRREHRLPVPRACELPSGHCPQRFAPPPRRRPQTRFLPLITRPHSPNPQLRRWTIPADLPTVPPIALLFLGG